MNINAVNGINSTNFHSKMKNFVQVVTEKRPLDNYTKEFILPEIKKVSKIAELHGKPVRIAQLEDNKLLANVGNTTGIVDLKTTPLEHIETTFRNLVRGNSIAEEQGYQKGIEYIELNAPEVGSKLNVLA